MQPNKPSNAPRPNMNHSELTRWYDKEGNPVGADLRKARKLSLLPSVTNIIKTCWPKPWLEEYQFSQIALAAGTCPRVNGETDEQWLAKVRKEADEHRDKAAAWGTGLHTAIHRANAGKEFDVTYLPWIEHWQDWVKDNVVSQTSGERAYVNHALGYAGRPDWIGVIYGPAAALLDFKNQSF